MSKPIMQVPRLTRSMVTNYGKYSSALPTMNDLRREVVCMSRDMNTLKSTPELAEVDGAAMAAI